MPVIFYGMAHNRYLLHWSPFNSSLF